MKRVPAELMRSARRRLRDVERSWKETGAGKSLICGGRVDLSGTGAAVSVVVGRG
jgi:hypothetical protein